MRISFVVILHVLSLQFGAFCYGQVVASPYEVGTWYNFRQAAISYTFDDNCAKQLSVAVPLFDLCGYKLTLFTITNWSPNWVGLRKAALNGHEIASHTVSHPSLDSLSDAGQLAELANSRETIESQIPKQKCMTIAYPNGHFGNIPLARKFYLAGRGGVPRIEGKTPLDFMSVGGFSCGLTCVVRTVADFKAKADGAVNVNGWCVFIIHAIDDDKGYNPLSSDTLRASLAYFKANDSKFWVAPFSTVARYVRERNSVSVSELSIQRDSVVVSVTDTLDNSIYNCPISIRRPMPSGWVSAIVMQNNKVVQSEIVQIDTSKYIVFNVVPNSGTGVTLKRYTAAGIQAGGIPRPVALELLQSYPNPSNPATIIVYNVLSGVHVNLRVYDVLGREVATLVDEYKQPGRYQVNFDATRMPSGTYFYSLGDGQNISTKKILLLK